MDKKIIIFSGPPGVGKNTAALATVAYIKAHARTLNPERRSLVDGLKDAVHKMWGIPYDGSYYDTEANRYMKDKPHPLLFNKTPRRMYIDMSAMMREKYGPDILGRIATNSMHNSKNLTFVFSSGGLDLNEWHPVFEWIGAENVLYVELHATVKSFREDTRGYMAEALLAEYPNLTVQRIVNTFSTDPFDRELFLIMVKGAVKKFLGIVEG